MKKPFNKLLILVTLLSSQISFASLPLCAPGYSSEELAISALSEHLGYGFIENCVDLERTEYMRGYESIYKSCDFDGEAKDVEIFKLEYGECRVDGYDTYIVNVNGTFFSEGADVIKSDSEFLENF